ncbi:MAG TPA: serine hydrolase domain-containing protein [Geminicoccaceae bacterium]|nr:serine hydrolase domain-containing protein [Geminicoccaceae bacterium]
MSLQTEADALLRQAAANGDVPGVVALATDSNGTIYEGGFGERLQGGGAAMTADTVVWIASMTKAITATAAMQLVEQGRLHLDRPAQDVAPALAEARVLDRFDDAGRPVTRPPARPVTLRHLLTHTAGFSYEFWQQPIIRYQEATGTPGIVTCEDRALTTPLLFDPGERWEYGISIDWAGKMVEAASGQKLGAYLQRNLFEPLGMRDTGFRITDDMRRRLAKIHQRGGDGRFEPQLELEIPQDPEFEMGGGGLYGTIQDYAKFVRMILNRGRADGQQLLKPETVQMMSTNQMGACRVGMLKTAMPPLSNDAEFFPGMPKTWGFSFMINTERAPTGRNPGSLAWAGLANSYFWIDPAAGIGGVYATQVLPFADKKALPLFLAFEKTVYDQLS